MNNKSLAVNNEIKEIIFNLFSLKIKVAGERGDDSFANLCSEFVQKLDDAKQSWALQNRDIFFTKMIMIEAFL